jgi:hypothetical protein
VRQLIASTCARITRHVVRLASTAWNH